MGAEPGQRPPPAVMVHDVAQAAAALALAGPAGVLLVSAPGAAGSLGPGWFLAIAAAAMARHPGVPCRAVLDCADAPGHALAALRAGAAIITLDGTCPGFAAVAGAAAACGAVVWPVRPPALDLARLDLRKPGARDKVMAWLRPGG